ncbi:Cobalt-precorrin-8 methylmutase [Nitrosopumilaceae archaeon]|nr:precorrin-8X methylmutase [Nitrosopumilus sp.]CAI9831709.1 Cobalt-precorrin-8 methylmutase [Nitrosopumilaceae archaeon]MDA7944446.1 precorrin-8X methylmutase [Nitrosopumilus sp.]MDA7954198.1 precorrin-8X methylmutase [Nitrosopumilus sp.]MDA7973206.1 precorrin-8X methylmutase [Nitrosopumilus sp.]
MQTEKGQSIEDESMRIIDEEAGGHPYKGGEWQVTRRIIHATADFDFAGRNAMIFSSGAVEAGSAALARGCGIVADVNGVVGGLNKQNLRDFGNTVACRISEPGMMEAARASGRTRAQESMRASAAEMDGGVVVVGNAPTALEEVIKMAAEGAASPALVVGIPVGFVCAAESKEELAGSGLPHITNSGRKGGSPAASAVINALFKIARSPA